MKHLIQQSCPTPNPQFIAIIALLCMLLSFSAKATVTPTDSFALAMVVETDVIGEKENEICFAKAKFSVSQTICTGKIQVQN